MWKTIANIRIYWQIVIDRHLLRFRTTFKPGESMITFTQSECECMSMYTSMRPMVTICKNLKMNSQELCNFFSLVYSANYSCIMHRLICTNLKEYCHADSSKPCKVGWCIFKCESRFKILPPLSCTLWLTLLASSDVFSFYVSMPN